MLLLFSLPFKWLFLLIGEWITYQFLDEATKRELEASPELRAERRRLVFERARAIEGAASYGVASAEAAYVKPLIMVDWKPGDTMLIQDNPMIEKRWRI